MLAYGLNKLYSDIFCFSTTRHGGVSTGAYASFNCNEYCGDDEKHVSQNRQLLIDLLPKRPDRLVIPHQTHHTEVCVIDDAFMTGTEKDTKKDALEGIDALVTGKRNVCLCVSTADCVPVLCFDTRLKVIAAIHAGWRGTVSRIVEKTLQKMADVYGTQGKDVVACIGPSISQEAFEVGDEVYEHFLSAGFDVDKIAVRTDKWHIDLWKANRLQLEAAGVCKKNIEQAGICTWQHNDDFFSARRQGIASGRILSGIMLL